MLWKSSDWDVVVMRGELMRKRPNGVYMHRVEGPFSVETNEGVMSCPDGYVAFDPMSGHMWPVSAEYVAMHYEAVPE